MIGALLGIGSIYWVLKDENKRKQQEEEDLPDTGDSTPPPQPITPTGDDYRVEKVGEGDKSNIYLLESRRGVLYDDGSGGYSWEDSGYLRGDFPSGFTSAPTSVAGSISFEINETYYEHVLVYSTMEAAIEADKEEESTPDDPVSEPEDDEDDGGGSTTLPDFGSGLGGGYTPFGGSF